MNENYNYIALFLGISSLILSVIARLKEKRKEKYATSDEPQERTVYLPVPYDNNKILIFSNSYQIDSCINAIYNLKSHTEEFKSLDIPIFSFLASSIIVRFRSDFFAKLFSNIQTHTTYMSPGVFTINTLKSIKNDSIKIFNEKEFDTACFDEVLKQLNEEEGYLKDYDFCVRNFHELCDYLVVPPKESFQEKIFRKIFTRQSDMTAFNLITQSLIWVLNRRNAENSGTKTLTSHSSGLEEARRR